VATQEVPSPAKTATISREDILKLIPQHEIKPFFVRPHLDRELIIGLIGLRGDGKSGSGASISLVDFMLRNKPCWSNMAISCDLEIDDTTAQQYGLRRGGVAHYEAGELDKEALLKLDDRYRGGCIFIDEINVQYSNVRRFMTNTNVDFNTVVQELRKFKSSLIYTVIDEMFIDSQLRTLTDVFIKSEDTALSCEGLDSRKPTGLDFKWMIYPMSGYLVGRENSYPVTKHPLTPCFFHFGIFRGIYNTDLFQRKGKYSKNAREQKMEATIETSPSPEVVARFEKWAWLEERALILKKSGIEFLEAYQLWSFLEINKHKITSKEIGGMIGDYGIRKHHQNKLGQWVYQIEQYNIEGITNQPLALV
jgi:hypothetical protein